MLLTLLFLPCLQTTQSDYFVQDDVPAYGSDVGTAKKIVTGLFDPNSATFDMIVLQGVDAELHLAPGLPSPSWLTPLTSSSVNDIAVLAGAGTDGEDVAITIGATGLQRHDWSPNGVDTFLTATLLTGSWAGGTHLHTYEEGTATKIVGVDAAGTSLLLATLQGSVLTEQTSLAIPSGLKTIEHMDWNQNGTQEIVLLFAGLGVFVIDPSGTVVDSFSVPGSDDHIAVSRSSVTGENDMLSIATLEPTSGYYMLLGVNEEEQFDAQLIGQGGVQMIATFDMNNDGRDDIALLDAPPAVVPSSPIGSTARLFERTGATQLSTTARTIDVGREGTDPANRFTGTIATADFDEDGDVDLGCISIDGTKERVWYNDHIWQDLYRPELEFQTNILENTDSVEVDLTVTFQAPNSNYDSILIEAWRVPVAGSPWVMDKDYYETILLPFNPLEVGPGVVFTLNGDMTLTSDTSNIMGTAFRLDATLVRTEQGEVEEFFVTSSTWYAPDSIIFDLLKSEAEWPVSFGSSSSNDPSGSGAPPSEPENTSGNVSGSGSTPGMDPPNTRTGG